MTILAQIAQVPPDAPLPYGLVAVVVGALVTAIGLLFWQLRQSEAARIADAKANTEWALKLQQQQNEAIQKLTAIADSFQRRLR